MGRPHSREQGKGGPDESGIGGVIRKDLLLDNLHLGDVLIPLRKPSFSAEGRPGLH